MKSIYKPKYWSIHHTAIISILIFLCFTLAQFFILTCLSYLHSDVGYEDVAFSNLGLISIFSSTIGFISLSIFIRLKKINLKKYLNIYLPEKKTSLLFVFLSFILMILMDWASAKYPLLFETDFVIDSYENAKSLPLFYLGVVFFAPFFEESLFRGFLFKGVEKSYLGGHAAVFISSILFALVHLQYGIPVLLFMLFPFSLLLGYARWKSGSLLLPVLIHVINNLMTCIVTHLEIY